MAKLTENTARTYELGDLNALPVMGGETIYKGAVVGLTTIGYARALQAGDKFAGFADEYANNSNGTDGETGVTVKREGVIVLEIAGVTLADVTKPVYASDDNTFTLTASGNSAIGRIIKVDGINASVAFNTIL